MAVACRSEEFDCPRCSATMRLERGCEGDSPLPGRWRIAGESYNRCPLRLVTGMTWTALGLFRQYKLGFLPAGGGVYEQSGLFWAAIEVVDRWRADLMERDETK